MLNLKDKKITIVGAQKSGIAIAELVLSLGGIPKMTEKKKPEDLNPEALRFLQNNSIALECGGHTKEFVADSYLLVLSPGVRFDLPTVIWAKENKIPVLGEIEFAFQFCDKPVIAITGSNGKTTTVTLTDKIIKEAGFKSCLCGNIGSPFSKFALQSDSFDYFVLEVSSFQMESLLAKDNKEGFKKFKPFIAAILNFNQNHLDRHKDMDEYFEAKARIFQNQYKNDFAVLNHSSEKLKFLAQKLSSKVVFFNDDRDNKFSDNQNHLAVLAIANILKIKPEICKKVFSEFKGVEHRLEWVRNLDGVEYINDSKSTTAEAGEWAINRMTKPIVMICGGSDKHLDYSWLKKLVKDKVKTMIVIGDIKGQLKNTFADVVNVIEGESFEAAVKLAQNNSTNGDCVLLSPMTASFDMFDNFEERGKVFKQIVNKLK